MTDNVLRPFVEGFRGSIDLWKGILLALLSVISVLTAFVNGSRIPDFRNTPRRSD
jgi:hypothetical protein